MTSFWSCCVIVGPDPLTEKNNLIVWTMSMIQGNWSMVNPLQASASLRERWFKMGGSIFFPGETWSENDKRYREFAKIFLPIYILSLNSVVQNVSKWIFLKLLNFRITFRGVLKLTKIFFLVYNFLSAKRT